MRESGRELGRQRTYRAILAAAAHVLADREADEASSMRRIALEAGVGRATLYRHFENRAALLQELARVGIEESGAGLRAGNVDGLPVEQALSVAIHVLCDVGDRYAAVFRDRVRLDEEQAEREWRAPLEALIVRAQREDVLRADLSPRVLREAITGLAHMWIRSPLFASTEERAATVLRLFLEGARAGGGAQPAGAPSPDRAASQAA